MTPISYIKFERKGASFFKIWDVNISVDHKGHTNVRQLKRAREM